MQINNIYNLHYFTPYFTPLFMAVTFLLKDKNKTRSSILIYISFRGQFYKRSTGESIPVIYWNQGKARCKAVREFRHGNDVNSVLDHWDASAMLSSSLLSTTAIVISERTSLINCFNSILKIRELCFYINI